MRVDATHRRWLRFSAVVQLLVFAFSASTSLLPCANDMVASTTKQAATAHHATPASHATHESHDPATTAPEHHGPSEHTSSGACPWVVGCTGMVQFAFESSWRLVETAPIVAAPAGVVLRAVHAEREVESPPPRA